MDLRVYYHNLRKTEADIADEFVVLFSHPTPDGGKGGRMTEVGRQHAAQAIVEGRGRLATPEEAANFYKTTADARRAAEQAVLASKIHVSLISESEPPQPRAPKSEKKQ